VSAARPAGDTPPASQQEGSPGRVSKLTPDELDVIARVRESLRAIRFGTVLIVVQDGKVVQIETAEKIRLR
jgi:hypothetical protein